MESVSSGPVTSSQTTSGQTTSGLSTPGLSRGVTILGSTGSIGVNTLDVISRHADKYHVCALSANRNVSTLLGQCKQFQPETAVMMDADSADKLRKEISRSGLDVEVQSGEQAGTPATED